MEFNEEISFIKNLYEKTAKDLEEMQNRHLSSLICEMKRFIQVYEAKLEQDSRLTKLKWKIERQKTLEDREDSDRDYEGEDDE